MQEAEDRQCPSSCKFTNARQQYSGLYSNVTFRKAIIEKMVGDRQDNSSAVVLDPIDSLRCRLACRRLALSSTVVYAANAFAVRQLNSDIIASDVI